MLCGILWSFFSAVALSYVHKYATTITQVQQDYEGVYFVVTTTIQM